MAADLPRVGDDRWDLAADTRRQQSSPPTGLLAEITHRCSLGCPYCCNPLELEQREDELDATTWARVFSEAAALGVSHVYLSGGEPGARHDLVDIVAHAREAGLATNLITSGVGITTRTLRDLWEAGLNQVQVSFQDADAVSADHIAGHRGAFQRKYALATEAVRLGLPLIVDVVVHRANIGRIGDMVDLAVSLKAVRIEIAHMRYHGWALSNRATLLPSADEMERSAVELEELRRKHGGRIIIDVSRGSRGFLLIAPSGRVRRDGAAASGIELSVREHPLADIMAKLPAGGAGLAADALRFADASYNGREGGLALARDAIPYHYRHMPSRGAR